MDEFFEAKTVDLSEIYEKYKGNELDDVLRSKLEGSFVREDVIDEETGEFIVESKELIDGVVIEKILDEKLQKLDIWEVKPEDRIIANAMLNDSTTTNDEAVIEVFRKLRPGDLVTVDSARSLVKQMFFNPQRYDLADVGRYKINKRLKINVPEDEIVLTKEDVLHTIEYVKNLVSGEGFTDDIDNLSNRRVRGVGELLSIQIKGGMLKMSKMVREKMTIQDITTLTPQSLLNTKPLNALILEFFGSGQLSQFMDQSNPLSELTHKRRISALGPGGLSRDRAGFEVRDVHNSHYGRICPIETPEGPNIGLIASLSTYGKVNKYGFIETPFVKIKNGKADFDDIEYLAADEEEGLFIAQADTPIDKDGNFVRDEKGRIKLIGDGIMQVRKDIGLKMPFSGMVALENQDIADIVASYFLQSEQIKSVVALGVKLNEDGTVNRAGGYLIQLLPGAEDDFIDKLEDKLRKIRSITELLNGGFSLERIVELLYEDISAFEENKDANGNHKKKYIENFEILEKSEIEYKCNCSKETFLKGLITLGKEQIDEILEEQGKIEVECHFCGKKYQFGKEDFGGAF